MLAIVSKTIQGMLQANVPPPLPRLQSESWVRIANASADAVSEHRDCLVMSLYRVEPDAFTRNMGPVSSRPAGSRPPLPLNLHYAFTFPSSSEEATQRALGGVIQAFHTTPSIATDDYLEEAEHRLLASQGAVVEHIRTELESPSPEQLGHLWSAMGNGLQLAVYYRVSVAMVPSGFDVRPPVVKSAAPPSVGKLPPSKDGRR